MERPELDISVVTYQSRGWIDGFLKSILASDLESSLMRLRFIDHSPDPACYDALQLAGKKWGQKFAGFEVYRQRNKGFGAGHNFNLERSSAPFFLVTNIDLEFESNTLSRLMSRAQADERDVASWEPRQKPYEHPKTYDPVTLEVTWSSHACVLFRSEALKHVGGYSKRLFLYGEDVELSYRMRDRGYRLRYCPDAVVWHYSYREVAEFKWRQFLGSSLANFLIRLRYGTLGHMAKIPGMYLHLWRAAPRFPNKVLRLGGLALQFVAKAPFFLATRRKSQASFPIRGFDYELTRDGAFYELQKTPQSQPLVSVVVRTYRGRLGFLRESVQSILNQTYNAVEVVVVEDGSDEAAAFLESLDLPPGKSIRHFPIDKSGRCVAGNHGLAQANGQFLNFLDDDDLFFADHLEVLVGEIMRQPELGAVYTNAWEVATEVTSLEPLAYREIVHSCRYRQAFSRRLLWRQNYIPIQAILFKRELFERHGGFDLDLDALEDWHLWIKYSLDADFKYISKTTSLYRTPNNPREAKKRQAHLDRYYQAVLDKQKEMSVVKTPRELLEYLK